MPNIEALDVPEFYSLVHRGFGPVSTFLTLQEAEDELADVLEDKPGWKGELWVEPFELVVRPSALP